MKKKKTTNTQENDNIAYKDSKYDKIVKENMTRCIIPLINQLFGLNIDFAQLQDVETDVQKTIERRPDVLKKVGDNIEPYLLHIEFQTQNEIDMHFRMLEYYALLSRKHNLSIKQYVIYIGNAKLNMQHEIKHKNLTFQFEIINLSEIDYQTFLQSNVPEFVLLGILANFGNDTPEQVVGDILEKIVAITNTEKRYKNTSAQKKFIQQIDVISRLRGFQHIIIQKLKNMALILDITTDLRYIQGREETLAEQKELFEKIQKEKETAQKEKETAQKEKETVLEKAQKEKEENIKKAHIKGMSVLDIADIFGVSIAFVKKIVK